MSTILKEEFPVAAMDFVTAGEASAQIKRLLKKLGVDANIIRRLAIACYEAGAELTPANAKKYTRFHPRCGTSFIFVILIISILIFSLVPWKTTTALDKLIMVLLRLCLLPVVTGVGFEFLMFAGKHPNKCTLALSFPGLLMQRITTKEPDEEQLEVAIKALKLAMPEEFPEEAAEYEREKAEEEKEKEGSEDTDAAPEKDGAPDEDEGNDSEGA